jgi:hypothetical protein
MKPRRLGVERDEIDGPQQKHPRNCGGRISVIGASPYCLLSLAAFSRRE